MLMGLDNFEGYRIIPFFPHTMIFVVVHRRIATLLSEKKGQSYSKILY